MWIEKCRRCARAYYDGDNWNCLLYECKCNEVLVGGNNKIIYDCDEFRPNFTLHEYKKLDGIVYSFRYALTQIKNETPIEDILEIKKDLIFKIDELKKLLEIGEEG